MSSIIINPSLIYLTIVYIFINDRTVLDLLGSKDFFHRFIYLRQTIN